MSRRSCGDRLDLWVKARDPCSEDAAHEIAFERASRLACGESLGATSLQICSRRRITPGLGERDHMEEHVEPAVAAAVQTMADRAGGRGLQRRDRRQRRELLL